MGMCGSANQVTMKSGARTNCFAPSLSPSPAARLASLPTSLLHPLPIFPPCLAVTPKILPPYFPASPSAPTTIQQSGSAVAQMVFGVRPPPPAPGLMVLDAGDKPRGTEGLCLSVPSICPSATHPDQPCHDLDGAGAHGGVGDLGPGDARVLKDGVGVKPDLSGTGLGVSRGAPEEGATSCQVSALPHRAGSRGEDPVGLTASIPESCMPAFTTATESVCQRTARSRSSCPTDVVSTEESESCSSFISCTASCTSGVPRNRRSAAGSKGLVEEGGRP